MSAHAVKHLKPGPDQLSLFQNREVSKRDPDQAELLREAEFKRLTKLLPCPLDWFYTKPLVHQLATFLFGMKHECAALLLPIGSGKCLSGKNLVCVNDDLITFAEFWEKAKKIGEEVEDQILFHEPFHFYTFGLDHDGTIKRTPIYGLRREFFRGKLQRIRLESGEELELTPDHRLFNGMEWTSRRTEVAVPSKLNLVSEPRQQIHRILEGEFWLRKVVSSELVDYEGWIYDLETPLDNYLAEGVFVHNSKAAIDIMRYRIDLGQVKRVLIVCPLSVISTWETELLKHSNLDFEIMEGSRIKKLGSLLAVKKPPEILICNYESVRIYKKAFIQKKFCMAIADESTKIKNPGIKLTWAFYGAFAKTKYKLILTGLPTPNNILDLYSQYKFLNPSVFGTRYSDFKNEYAKFAGEDGNIFIGPKNIEKFRRKLYTIGITFKRKQLFDLPPKTYQVRTVTLSAKERTAYRSMKEEFLAWLSASDKIVATNVLTQFLRLHQINSGFLTKDGVATEIGTSKLKAFTDYMQTEVLGTETKTLVFIQFIHTLKKVQAWAEKKKLNPSVVYGGVRKKRADEIRKFQNDPTSKIFIGQISTVNLGLDLTAANIAIFLESNFSWGDRHQCEGRIDRYGQTRKTTIIDFIVPDSIDSYILKVLRSKRQFSESILRPQNLAVDGEKGLF